MKISLVCFPLEIIKKKQIYKVTVDKPKKAEVTIQNLFFYLDLEVTKV